MRIMHLYPCIIRTVCIVLLSAAGACAAAPENRFFLVGSGALHLENLRNSREDRVNLLDGNGVISETALTAVDRVFGFPVGEGEHMNSPVTCS